MFTGVKYFAITHQKLHDKRPYDPHLAYLRAAEHAGNFMQPLSQQVHKSVVVIALVTAGSLNTSNSTAVLSLNAVATDFQNAPV